MITDDSFRSGNSKRLSWPSFVPFEVCVYLCDYAEGLDAWHFQAIPAREDGSSAYYVHHDLLEIRNKPQVSLDVCRGARNGLGTVLRHNNALYLYRSFSHCTVERG